MLESSCNVMNQAIPVRTDQDIAATLNTSTRSIERVRRSFVEDGLESALNPKVQKHYRPKKLDGAAEAFLVATVVWMYPKGGRNGRCSY